MVRLVPPDDAKQIQEIFFGGNSWLVSCVTNKTAASEPPSILQAAAELLRPRGVRVARVHCWEPLETKKGRRTLAQRFGFRDKPPVVMATKGKGSPSLLVAKGLQAEELAAKALAAVIPDASDQHESPTVRDGSRGKSGHRVEKVGRRPEPEEEIAKHDPSEEHLKKEEQEEVESIDLDIV
mmetsp:Transcript_16175/g.30440  ORF Transcript_16175/g.30440 Transcript_16175/m.30440 type:complete len:181 (+) Transcript_16175:3-545(+)